MGFPSGIMALTSLYGVFTMSVVVKILLITPRKGYGKVLWKVWNLTAK